MTRVDTDQVHVSLNGEGSIVELSPGGAHVDRKIEVQDSGDPGQPHAHWMSHDGHTMVTPNSNTNDSTVVHVVPGTIEPKVATGVLPIASGMMPDASKYYVSNYESSTISVIDLTTPHPKLIKNINLLANYDPITGAISGPVGALPIQTPVSPNGKWVYTANTLTATRSRSSTRRPTRWSRASVRCRLPRHQLRREGRRRVLRLRLEQVLERAARHRSGPEQRRQRGRRCGRRPGAPRPRRQGTKSDDVVTGNAGMGGQGVLPIPIVYNGWVQNVPNTAEFKGLTCEQRHPIGGGNC